MTVLHNTVKLTDSELALILSLLDREVNTNGIGKSVSAAMLYRKLEMV